MVAWPDGESVLGRAVHDRIRREQHLPRRPVDLLVMKDGSMLVSDDFAGAIYRISYTGQ
ncbi:MAG: sorbosone dehydrogenase [Burkholderiaceae bacterium]